MRRMLITKRLGTVPLRHPKNRRPGFRKHYARQGQMTSIKISMGQPKYESPNDYGEIFVQGGTSGLVISSRGNYQTAFVECFPSGSFIRGEGETLAEADAACFAKLQAYLGCPRHEWEARGYRNGGGFCKHCGQFGSQVVTPEDLDLYCATCGTPTFHTLNSKKGSASTCEKHDPFQPYRQLFIEFMITGSTKHQQKAKAQLESMLSGQHRLNTRKLKHARKALADRRTPAARRGLEWADTILAMRGGRYVRAKYGKGNGRYGWVVRRAPGAKPLLER